MGLIDDLFTRLGDKKESRVSVVGMQWNYSGIIAISNMRQFVWAVPS